MYQGTDHVFEGRALNELIDDLAKAGPAATALSQNAAGYERLSGVLGDMQARLRAAMNEARAAHQGAAADASQEYTGRQAAYADHTTAEAAAAKGSVTAQSQHYSDTLARMPKPAEAPSVWEGATIPLDPSHSYIAKVRDYAGRQREAVDAMNSYQAASNDTVQRFALFSEPAVSPVAIGEQTGTGRSGFPGGGAATAVQSASGGAGGAGGAVGSSATAPGTAGGGALPVVPQQVMPPVRTEVPGRGSTPRATPSARKGTGQGAGAPGVPTPLRPRAGAPGAWGSGNTPEPRGTGGAGGAGEGAAARGGPAGRAGGLGSGFMPMGAGAARGRGDEERRRPSWLLEDDPEAAFGPMPPHAPPVIEASDPWRQR